MSKLLRTAAVVSCGLTLIAVSTPGALADPSSSRRDRGFDAQFRQVEKNRDRLKSEDASDAAKETSTKDNSADADTDEPDKLVPRMKFYSGAAVLGGYDSNLDLSKSKGAGTSFGMVDVGVASVVTRENSETTAIARGSFAHHRAVENHDMELRSDRWDGGFLVDHYMKLSERWKAHVGAFIERNEIELDRPTTAGIYSQLATNGKTEDAFIRLRSLQTQFGNPVETVVNGGFLSEINSSFNNTKTEAAVGMLVLKDRALAPFFEVSAARIDFPNQINTAVLNKNATEFYGIAGVRITLNPKLHIDLGGRVNNRELDDTRVSHHTGAFFDGKVVWAPTDMIDVEINVERKNAEAISGGALFTERTSADLQITAKLNEKVKARVEVGVVRSEQIGLNKHFDERYVEGRIGYQVNKRIELFTTAKAEAIKDSETADVSERVRVGAGVKVGF
jgi:Putative beta-barrel porin 2